MRFSVINRLVKYLNTVIAQCLYYLILNRIFIIYVLNDFIIYEHHAAPRKLSSVTLGILKKPQYIRWSPHKLSRPQIIYLPKQHRHIVTAPWLVEPAFQYSDCFFCTISILKNQQILVCRASKNIIIRQLIYKRNHLIKNTFFHLASEKIISIASIANTHYRYIIPLSICLLHVFKKGIEVEKSCIPVNICHRIFKHNKKDKHTYHTRKADNQYFFIYKLNNRRYKHKSYPNLHALSSSRIYSRTVFFCQHQNKRQQNYSYCICYNNSRTICINYIIRIINFNRYDHYQNIS